MTNWCSWKEHSSIPSVYQGGSSTGKEATGVPLKDTTYITKTKTSLPEVGFKLFPSNEWKVNMHTENNVDKIHNSIIYNIRKSNFIVLLLYCREVNDSWKRTSQQKYKSHRNLKGISQVMWSSLLHKSFL